MKKGIKKLLSFVLCMCLCMPAFPVQAEEESATSETTFTATLDKASIYESSVDQTVVMTVNADQPTTLAAIGATVYCDNAFMLTGITSTDTRIDFTGNVNVDNGKIDWYDSDLATYSDVTNIAVATFTVPANTSAGNYEVGLKELILLDGNGNPFVNEVTVSATLEVKSAEEVINYAAGISASGNALEVGDTVNINIAVSHSTEAAFAAAEITVGYDSSVLSFDAETFKTNYPSVSADTAIANTLKLVDHGASKTFGENGYVYTVPFKADAAADNTNVTLDSAGFATQTEAETKDLVVANRNPESVTLNISKKSLTVTLPEGDILLGEENVIYGESYTFILADKDNYDYTIESVTVGGTDVTESIIDNGDGSYTVPSVTGEMVINATRTAKSYSVTIEGTAGEGEVIGTTGEDAATYGTAYTFTVPVNSEEYSYEVAITIDGSTYTNATSVSGTDVVTYTVPGTDITGDIVITVTKTALGEKEVAVTIPSGVDATGDAIVTIGQSYTLTLTEEAGYIYMVTATMENSDSVALTEGTDDAGNKTYTIANVTGAIVFNITKTVDINGVTVSQYIQLNGTIMWLVENTTVVAEGKVPTYNGANMFWSDAYGSDADGDNVNDGAYCYLVISGDSADTVLAAAKSALSIASLSGTVVEVTYDNDVNETGKVDASDAQLVWNMYNVKYSDFTEDVTVAKFLEADVNGDKTVDTEDAAAIISAILENAGTN
ncbi:MAG: hypothetical protein IJZ34_15530 [Lachnospiraceae bacterium]|nr:hypothetical protein [Lachnospiraceae bacterium]